MAPGWLWVLQTCEGEQRKQELAQNLLSPAPVLPHTIDCAAWCAAAGTAGWDRQAHSGLSPAMGTETINLQRSKAVKFTRSTERCTALLCQLCRAQSCFLSDRSR